jgi:enoyl-CoA hydratase
MVEVADEVLFECVDGHIAIATLNRPRVLNAVNAALASKLEAHAQTVENAPDLWAAILASSNDRAFCAGADLSEVAAGRAKGMSTAEGGFAGFVKLPRRKPWIAAVRGAAMGGGCELALSCDMIVAGESARFGLPEVKRGLLAAAGGVYRLPRAIPRNIALEMIATGQPISAARAAELGLVNRVVPDSEVLDAALALARDITANAPLAVQESLEVARLHNERTDAELRELSFEANMRLRKTEDYKEGPRAFLEKRPAIWTGR